MTTTEQQLTEDGLVKASPSVIFVYGGGIIDPLNPAQEDIQIEWIAHHLSNMCRWTGAVERFLSVAEHLVLASMITPTLDCLMHDASEAALSDIARPVKKSEDFEAYMIIEENLERAIAKRFGLTPPPMSPEVKYADDAMLHMEAKVLVPHLGALMPEPPPETPSLWCWEPHQAKNFFLERFVELGGVA